MQKQFILLLVIAGLLSVGLTNCKKDKTKTKTQLLTEKSWKFDKATADGSDASSFIPACDKDNIITFVSNGTGTVNEGIIVCVPPKAGSFTWSFSNNETILTLSGSILAWASGSFTIVSLTETELVLSQPMSIPGFSVPVLVVVTFKH